jgi:ABC-2 type transport system ATP-binding protein
VIETTALTKTFGSLVAVEALDLNVGAGQLFGFLGPNGAGKTTTIRMLVGLLQPSSGSGKVAGCDIVREPQAAKARIGYVPDNPVLFDKLTGREFLEFSGDLYRMDRSHRDNRIDTLLELFELRDRAHDMLQSYSRGMRQKISLAAALLHEPDVLFLDEPTVGLDPKSARLMKDILRDFSRGERAVFLSTHILEIAERMCSHVAIINKGKLIASGTLEQLRDSSRSGSSLEDIFLQLTGGEDEDVAPLLAALER